MRHRVVFHCILDELEARQADRVVRQMVRAARVAGIDVRHADRLERLHPLAEDRRHGLVLLQVDAADRAGPVVDVEVRRELVPFGLDRRHARGNGRPRGHLSGSRRCRSTSSATRTAAARGGRAEMRVHIHARADDALLLTRPQADAHRAAQLDAALLENAHRFHHRRRAGRVVGRAR